MATGDGPYNIVQKVGDNEYKVEFSGDMNISTSFNVEGLTPYIEYECEALKIWGQILFKGKGWCEVSYTIHPPQPH